MIKNSSSLIVLGTLLGLGLFLPARGRADSSPGLTLWDISFQNARFHQFSTLFTAHDVKQYLSSDEGLRKAAEWCKQTGITKVYVESFRDGYLAERATLQDAIET